MLKLNLTNLELQIESRQKSHRPIIVHTESLNSAIHQQEASIHLRTDAVTIERQKEEDGAAELLFALAALAFLRNLTSVSWMSESFF